MCRVQKSCILVYMSCDVRVRVSDHFTCSKFRYDTFQRVNNKGADRIAWVHRLVYTFIVRNPPIDKVWSHLGPYKLEGSLTRVQEMLFFFKTILSESFSDIFSN